MTDSISPKHPESTPPSHSSGNKQPNAKSFSDSLPADIPLDNIKVNPGDEKLLDTPFGKMFSRMGGADSQDKTTLIKEVKVAITQYCNQLGQNMKAEQARMEKAMQRLKRVAQGQDPDD